MGALGVPDQFPVEGRFAGRSLLAVPSGESGFSGSQKGGSPTGGGFALPAHPKQHQGSASIIRARKS